MFSERTTTDRADRFGDCCLPEYGSVAIDKDKTLFHGGRGNDGADVTDRGNVDGAADVIKAQRAAAVVESLDAVVVGSQQGCATIAIGVEATDIGPDLLAPAVVTGDGVAGE